MENVVLWIMAIIELVARCFYKIFWWLAIPISILYVIGIEGGTKSKPVTNGDLVFVFVSILIFTVLSSLWLIIHFMRKVEEEKELKYARIVKK